MSDLQACDAVLCWRTGDVELHTILHINHKADTICAQSNESARTALVYR